MSKEKSISEKALEDQFDTILKLQSRLTYELDGRFYTKGYSEYADELYNKIQVHKQEIISEILSLRSHNETLLEETSLNKFRDMFFNCESSFRHGYMDGISDAFISSSGKTPCGEEKRWQVFSKNLKSWEPKPETKRDLISEILNKEPNTKRALKILKKLEFSSSHSSHLYEGKSCPICDGIFRKHTNDCELSALICELSTLINEGKSNE